MTTVGILTQGDHMCITPWTVLGLVSQQGGSHASQQMTDDDSQQRKQRSLSSHFASAHVVSGRLLFHSIPFRRLVCHPDQGARNLYLRLMYFAAFENKPLYNFWWKCRNLESINFRELGCLIPKCNDAKMCRDPKKAVQLHKIIARTDEATR